MDARHKAGHDGHRDLNPPLQRAREDRARGAAVELHRIATGGRVIGRHLDDRVDLVVADLEAGERVRHAGLLAQLQHEVEEGEALGVPMGVAGAVRQLWQIANNELGPGSDFTEIVKCIERWAGAEVRAKGSK